MNVEYIRQIFAELTGVECQLNSRSNLEKSPSEPPGDFLSSFFNDNSISLGTFGYQMGLGNSLHFLTKVLVWVTVNKTISKCL